METFYHDFLDEAPQQRAKPPMSLPIFDTPRLAQFRAPFFGITLMQRQGRRPKHI